MYPPDPKFVLRYSDFFESLMEFGKLVLSSGMYVKERNRDRQRQNLEAKERTELFFLSKQNMKFFLRMKLWAAGNYPIIGKFQKLPSFS